MQENSVEDRLKAELRTAHDPLHVSAVMRMAIFILVISIRSDLVVQRYVGETTHAPLAGQRPAAQEAESEEA